MEIENETQNETQKETTTVETDNDAKTTEPEGKDIESDSDMTVVLETRTQNEQHANPNQINLRGNLKMGL